MDDFFAELNFTSFEKWGKTSPTYSDLYITLTKETLQIAIEYFKEAKDISHISYEIWWATNHNKFIRHCKQREMLLMHEIMCKFITDYKHGRLMQDEKPTTKKQAKARN